MRWFPTLSFASILIVFLCPDEVGSTRDPYRVLRVNSNASQSEIKQAYRKLCLKYHPDKNRNNPKREELETRFKEVQEAYDRIGTEASRRQYDSTNRFGNFSTHSRTAEPGRQKSTHFFHHQQKSSKTHFWDDLASRQQKDFDDFMREYQKMFEKSSTFYNSFQQAGSHWSQGKNSIFRQRVKLPLEELYRGNDQFEFRVVDERPWVTIMAAFRGGIAPSILYRSLLYALPLYRISGWIAAAFAAYYFYQSIPKPSIGKSFLKTVPQGCQIGKTFVFQDYDSNISYQFEVTALDHELFRLEGSDTLWTTYTVSPQKARKGCIIRLKVLSGKQIRLELPPRVKDGQVLTIPREGWPTSTFSHDLSNAGRKFGDLRVRIRVSSKGQGQSR